MKLLILGLGYLGEHVLQTFTGKIDKIWGTVRRDISPKESSLMKFDEHSSLKESVVKEATHILQTIPPVMGANLFLKHHKKQLVQSENLKWMGYCSTTGVYGDTHGKGVTEESDCHPTQERSIERKNLEQEWMELYQLHAVPVHIFRLSSIYGPHRNQIQNIIQGKARRIQKKDQVFSRIHVEDIVQVLKASMKTPHPGEIYNLADDYPCSANEIIEYVSQELNLPLPIEIPLESPEVSDMVRSFYAECRRVSNSKIKQDLGIFLKYPSYRHGLETELKSLRMKA